MGQRQSSETVESTPPAPAQHSPIIHRHNGQAGPSGRTMRSLSTPSSANRRTQSMLLQSSSHRRHNHRRQTLDESESSDDQAEVERFMTPAAFARMMQRFNQMAGNASGPTSTTSQQRLNNFIARHGGFHGIMPFFDLRCPVCKKTVPSDDAEMHLVMCMTRPKITYNEDILAEHKGECVICFEDLTPGQQIARLPCLCIYHKVCIDKWFDVKNSCPEHPGDD